MVSKNWDTYGFLGTSWVLITMPPRNISVWFVPRTLKLMFVLRSNCIFSKIFNYRSKTYISSKSLLINTW